MQERRRRQRLPWLQIEARVRVRKSLLSSGWEDVRVVDYSRLGMGIVTDQSFKAGETIQLSLRLATEVGDITVEKINASVRNAQTEAGGTRFGLEFEANPKRDLDEALARIESILSRYSEVTNRMRE